MSFGFLIVYTLLTPSYPATLTPCHPHTLPPNYAKNPPFALRILISLVAKS